MIALVDGRSKETEPSAWRPKVKRYPTDEIVAHLMTPKTFWCPGCSNGIVLRSLVEACLSLRDDPTAEFDINKLVVVAGIGCSGRLVQYVRFNTVHTAHGRALAVATGIKFADPSAQVVVVMGDGDCMAIGGNHLIHAARRNINLTALIFNNGIYGMTGGQLSPATFEGDRSATSAYGSIEQAFDPCEFARAAGATFVARGTAYDSFVLTKAIAAGVAHKGFSFIEAVVTCPTYYGRLNNWGSPGRMLLRQKEYGVPIAKFQGEERSQNAFPVGVLHHREREEYGAAYEGVIERARSEA